MLFNKRTTLLVLMAVTALMPCFGQRFTKKEQALREARQINYFYGNSFTLSSGYVHSWLSPYAFVQSTFGHTGSYENTRESFAFSFAWDYAKKRTYGYQIALSYAQFGGEKLTYLDQGLGYGQQLRPDLCSQIHLNEVMLQPTFRYFIPLTYTSRLSVNAGIYVSRIVGSYGDRRDWDMGAAVGLGFDWKHLSVGVNYMPGVYPDVIKSCDSRIGALTFSVGVHLWK